MSSQMSEKDLAEVKAIIANSTLRSVDYYEVSARRNDGATQSGDSDQGRLTVEVQQRVDDTSFGIRLQATVVLPVGEATASVAGEYDLLNGVAPRRRALQLFANEVAVMTVLPYLREAIATITAKVFGQPVHLPIAERGEIALDVDDDE